jgi:outer membrane lipoprotein-sorting protein
MKRYSFLILIVFCISNSIFGQEMTPMQSASEFTAKLKEASKQTNSITADFTEEKYASYLKEPQKSAGKFYYKKKDKLRWEIISPIKYIFISNEDKIKIQDNGKDVNVSSANQVVHKIQELMLTLVNGEFNSSKMFAPNYFETTDSYYVKLIPKNKRLADLFNDIELCFSKETLLLKELDFHEKSGDKSIMMFSNSKTNQLINDSVFTNF